MYWSSTTPNIFFIASLGPVYPVAAIIAFDSNVTLPLLCSTTIDFCLASITFPATMSIVPRAYCSQNTSDMICLPLSGPFLGYNSCGNLSSAAPCTFCISSMISISLFFELSLIFDHVLHSPPFPSSIFLLRHHSNPSSCSSTTIVTLSPLLANSPAISTPYAP